MEKLNLKVDISTENHHEAWVGSVYKPIIFVIIVKLALADSDSLLNRGDSSRCRLGVFRLKKKTTFKRVLPNKKRLIHRVKQGGEKLAQLQLTAQRVEMNIMFIY